LRAKSALDRIALIDETRNASRIANALIDAGYEVLHVQDDAPFDGEELVLRISPRRQSGIAGRTAPLETGEANATQKTGEKQLRELREIESLGRLAGGIAHDFNNILSVISICTDEVLDAMSPGDPNRVCLEDIRGAVERGSALTRDLLAFSRRGILEPRLVDLHDIVIANRRMIERILGSDVRMETVLAAHDARVRIDSSQWSSVFVNLALNARCAMPNGGSLVIRTRTLVIDPASRGRDNSKGLYVELSLTDTGCGMPEDVQERIFEPFFTTKSLGKGVGLGLSVVHGIVEESGGWIEATSQVGAGSTFRIFLPAVGDAPTVADVHRPHLPDGRQATLLVVEDEDAVRRVALRALQRSGYRVFDAGSAEDAVALLADVGPIDLLVTDVVLPGMDGRRLAELLSQRSPGLAVLYTSGYTDDEGVRYGVSRSEMSFLQKPYSTARLIQRVEEVLARAKSVHR
jgi:signal transduction histidine kinase/CheY-like chemotaxis protein